MTSETKPGSDFGFLPLPEDEPGPGCEDVAPADPIRRAVEEILFDAFEHDFVEVHFDRGSNGLFVRMRDRRGALHTMQRRDLNPWALTAWLKIMAKVDISLSSLPQEGRIELESCGRTMGGYFATLPTVRGERIVVWISTAAPTPPPLRPRGALSEAATAFASVLDAGGGLVIAGGAPECLPGFVDSLLLEADPGARIVALLSSRSFASDERVLSVPLDRRFDLYRALLTMPAHGVDAVVIDEPVSTEALEIAVQLANWGTTVVVPANSATAEGVLRAVLQRAPQADRAAAAMRCVLMPVRYRRLCQRCRRQTAETVWEAPGCGHCIDGGSGDIYLYRAFDIECPPTDLADDSGNDSPGLRLRPERWEATFRLRRDTMIKAGEIDSRDAGEE